MARADRLVRRGTIATSLVCTVLVAACGASVPPSLVAPAACEEPSAEAARALLEGEGYQGDIVAEPREPDARAYIFRLSGPNQPPGSATILMTDDCLVVANYGGTLLDESVAATVTRMGASSGGGDGEMTVEPGYLVGIVRDPAAAAIEVRWDDGADGQWTLPVASGPFLAAVPDDVPLGAELRYRVLDPEGDVLREILPGE